MLAPILFIHRWLGVLVGLVMTVWCLSGFVMMYSDYPRLLPQEQRSGLAPLVLPSADAVRRIDLPADTALASVRLEMLGDHPVLRVTPAIGPERPIAQMRAVPAAYDLTTGQPIAPLSPEQARQVGDGFARYFGIAGRATGATAVPVDQWTVQTFRGHQPLYRVDFADAAGSTVYVAGNSGEVVQQTTGGERFWGWLGAVPHWLYPTILRQNGALWSQVVVWTSLIGCFLTMTGLWVGISRLRRDKSGRLGSPYSGLWWWHHMFGLAFGLLTLTWVASGLLSMNPWGLLDSMAGFSERSQLAGPLDWRRARTAIVALDRVPPGTVRIDAVPLGGRIFLAATDRFGQAVRYDAQGKRAPLARAELEASVRRSFPVRSFDLLREEDDYYYAHKFTVTLPVWRAQLDDAERTLLYIDPQTGGLIRAFDANGRRFRWLQDGLHSLDFPVLRRRPIWDVVMLPLLAAVTLICATGTWMGLRKVKRDAKRYRLARARDKTVISGKTDKGEIA